MPERSSLTQGVQIGVEATPGTNVAANKKLVSIGFSPAIKMDPNRFLPMGQKYASIVVPGKEWVEAKIDGVGSYSELIYAFASCMVAPSAPSVTDVTAQTWTFTPSAIAEDTVKTYSVEQGGVVRAQKFSYGLITEIEIDINRDQVNVAGTMMGQRISDGITMTSTPTAIIEAPILPTDIDVFMDPSSGALGTTKLTRVINANFHLNNRFGPVWVLNTANTSYVAHVETEPTAELKLMQEADTEGMQNLTQMRAGSSKFVRLKGTSTVLAGNTTAVYSMQIDMAAKVKDVGDFSDSDGVYAIEWTFEIVYDATWAKAYTATLVNKQTAL